MIYQRKKPVLHTHHIARLTQIPNPSQSPLAEAIILLVSGCAEDSQQIYRWAASRRQSAYIIVVQCRPRPQIRLLARVVVHRSFDFLRCTHQARFVGNDASIGKRQTPDLARKVNRDRAAT